MFYRDEGWDFARPIFDFDSFSNNKGTFLQKHFRVEESAADYVLIGAF